jgi:hypothetical protein
MGKFFLGICITSALFLAFFGWHFETQRFNLCGKLYPIKKDFDYCYAESKSIDLEFKFTDKFVKNINKKINKH